MINPARDTHPIPYPVSYWVIPGRLLAGEYPLSLPNSGQYVYDRRLSDAQRLSNLLDLGINYFIDLTEEGEWPSYWPELTSLAALHRRDLVHRRYPIVDHSMPPVDVINRAIADLQHALTGGHNVLVHCKAGIGRTALVIGAYLVRQGLTGDQALARIAELRAAVPDPRPAPLVDDQRNLLRSWPVD